MRRDPSLHITRSALVSVLRQIQYDRRMMPEDLADSIFAEAQPYQLKDRYKVEATARMRKKVVRSTSAENPIIEKFNFILQQERLKAGHKVVKTVTKTSKDYLVLKEVAKIAFDFGEALDITPRDEAYREFIRIGLRMMNKKYSLSKFKFYAERIVQEVEDKAVVIMDENPEGTRTVKECFYEILDADGIHEVSEDEYGRYVHFVHARVDADSVDADYYDWVQAQFEAMAFMNAVPELSQLHGENAHARYQKYVLSGSVSERQEQEDYSGLSEEEIAYREALKKNRK